MWNYINTQTINYSLNISRIRCVLHVLYVLIALTIPVYSFGADLQLKKGEEHTFSLEDLTTFESGEIVYYWSVNGEELEDKEESASVTMSWDEAGDYELTASYSVNGCLSPETIVTIEVIDDSDLPDIIPDKFFSPDGDGVHDFWYIKNIEYFPDAHIEIYDRFHKCLLKTRGLQFIENNGWDGMYNGHQVPSNDYWYYIRDLHFGKPKSGHFILKRGSK